MSDKPVIMVIDDSEDCRSLVKKALSDDDKYEIIEAENGSMALETLKENPSINLFLCDVHMPEMNGIELIKAVKELPSYKSTPICFLTSEVDPAIIDQLQNLGANGFLMKPVNRQKLIKLTSRLIG